MTDDRLQIPGFIPVRDRFVIWDLSFVILAEPKTRRAGHSFFKFFFTPPVSPLILSP
jgi:hypothetical protein